VAYDIELWPFLDMLRSANLIVILLGAARGNKFADASVDDQRLKSVDMEKAYLGLPYRVNNFEAGEIIASLEVRANSRRDV